MEQNIETPVETQVVESPVETEVNTPVEKVEEPFKPWKTKEEPKQEQSIPYSRFKEVNDEKKAYASKIEEYEAKLATYEKRSSELDAIKTPEDIKIDDYDNAHDYLKARDTAIKNAAIKEVEERFIEREQKKIQESQMAEINNNYNKNLTEAYTRNPEIKEAVAFIDQYAEHINPNIAYELMIDENVGELLYDITTNQALLTEMFKGNPVDFIRKLHKMSAKIDRDTRYGAKESGSTTASGAVEVPKALDKRAEIKSAIPAQVKSTPKYVKDVAKMSMAEYREYRKSL